MLLSLEFPPENSRHTTFRGCSDLTVFKVASSRALDSIRNLLGREIQAWHERGVTVSVTESSAGDLLVFHCEVTKPYELSGVDVLKRIKGSLANGLSNIIIDEYEKLLVERLLDDQYAYLSARDREIIKKKVLNKLGGQGDQKSFKSILQRKSRIWAKLAEYLEKENEIVLEGFITFRLKEYLEELFDVVDSTVEDYLMEREYREFLKLLRHFMERQKSRIETLNIVRRENDDYRLLDSDGKPIGGEIRKFLEKGASNLDLGIDDLVASAVVTLAPQKVIWHGSKENSACFDLLQDLLEDSLEHCSGCSLEGAKEHSLERPEE